MKNSKMSFEEVMAKLNNIITSDIVKLATIYVGKYFITEPSTSDMKICTGVYFGQDDNILIEYVLTYNPNGTKQFCSLEQVIWYKKIA